MGTVTLPASLIAPNSYSFLCVVWTKNSNTIYDNLENICPVKIYDNGTELAVFEGIDYGNVILDTQWK
jgi:lipopolysaccharide transport system ATP-binding protein